MTDNKYPDLPQIIRDAGGIVHSDGNIFFKNASAFMTAADRAMRAAEPGLKDHEVAALVNRLRDVAIRFHDSQQLRERIAALIRPLSRSLEAQAAPAAVAGPSDAAILLGKYKKLCQEIRRGDGFHLQRIEDAIASLSAPATQPAPQPAAPQGDDSEPGWLQRLRAEQRDLSERYESLFRFIEGSSFPLIDAVQQNLLRQQVNLEHKLLQTLNQRIHSAAERHRRSKNHG